MAKVFNSIATFLRETKAELNNVTWLSKNDTVKYTVIVIGISLAVAAFLGGLDYVFQILIEKLAM